MPAKAGVLHLVRHAALELAEFGIRVNAIALSERSPTSVTAGSRRTPMPRPRSKRPFRSHMAETSQIATLALMLASDASSFMTGAHVVIDGGVQLGNFK